MMLDPTAATKYNQSYLDRYWRTILVIILYYIFLEKIRSEFRIHKIKNIQTLIVLPPLCSHQAYNAL